MKGTQEHPEAEDTGAGPELRLIDMSGAKGRGHYDLMYGESIMAGILWTEWVHEKGYRYCPMTASRSFSRVLRPTVRETLIKAVKLKAKIADKLISKMSEDTGGQNP